MTHEEYRRRNNASRRKYYLANRKTEIENAKAWRKKNPLKYAEIQMKMYQKKIEELKSEVQKHED